MALIARRWLRIVLWALGAVLLLLVSALGFLKCRYGGGKAYPSVATTPIRAEGALEPLVSLPFPPGNVAVSAEGRIFFNYHPFAQAHRFGDATVFELVDGQPRPFPNLEAQAAYQGVFGMTVDRQQRIWFIEPKGLDHERTRLSAFDLISGQKVFEHWFAPDVAEFAQDLRVAADGKTVYLADTGLFKFTAASLIVFDVAAKTHRVVLAGHAATAPRDWVIQTKHGPHRLGYGLITFSVGVDGLELSADGAWLYFGAMNHDRMYRVPTAALGDVALSPRQLAAKVEDVGPKPLSDGITIDGQGRLLITDVEHGGIMRLAPDSRELVTLVASPKVVWADGVVLAPDGQVLFTDSAIPAYIDQLARPPTKGRLAAAGPYHIYRFRP